jgi:NitT/TauT family transport system substrate-binding protein
VPLPDPIRRRSLAAAAALLASGAAVRGSLAQIRPEEGRVAIAVGARSTVSYLPLTIAAQLGYFRAEGLDVTLIDLPDEAGALQALGAGAADVASCTYEHTIRLQARGPALQSFVLQGRTPQIAVGISTRTMSGYRGVAGPAGAAGSGVSASESATQSVLGILLRRGGLTPADVSLVSVGMGAGALNALRSGQIDAISNVEPVMTMLEHRGDVRILADTRSLAGAQDILGGPMPAGCLCASTEYVQKTSRHLPGPAPMPIVRALKWLRTAGPGDIVRTVPEEYLLGDRGLYLLSLAKVIEAFSLDGLMPQDGARTALRVLQDGDVSVRADRVNLGQTYTNTFARVAKDRFKA